jgi:parallel beta-helix repeat protein
MKKKPEDNFMMKSKCLNWAVLFAACLAARVTGAAGDNAKTEAREYWVDAENRSGKAADNNPGSKDAPWKTLARAFSDNPLSLRPGDTLRLRGGEYPGPVKISKSGEPGKPISLAACPGETPVVRLEGRNGPGLDFGDEKSPGGNHIALDGLTIEGPLPAEGEKFPQDLIYASGKNDISAANCRLRGGAVGIDLWQCGNVKISGNIIRQCRSRGIQIADGGRNISITGNKISNIGEIEERRIVQGGAIGILSIGPLRKIGVSGILSNAEPAGERAVMFQINDKTSGNPLSLNFRPWERDIEGRNPGELASPAVLALFESESPSPSWDREIGGGEMLESGVRAFALLNNPAWDGDPFSPDGNRGLIDRGDATFEEIKKAKHAFLYYRFLNPADCARDVIVENNEVSYCAYEGIHFRVAENVLVRGNYTHHIGCTGIQIETQCRNIWIERNRCEASSRTARQEAGIWYADATDGVIQDNIAEDGVFGFFISSCSRVIMRRNLIMRNTARHVYTPHEKTGKPNKIYAEHNASGLYMVGPGVKSDHYIISGATGDLAAAHNLICGNGVDACDFGGGATLGREAFPVSNVLFLNNILYGNRGKCQLLISGSNIYCGGNLFGGLDGAFTVTVNTGRWPDIKSVSYNLMSPEGAAKMRGERRMCGSFTAAAIAADGEPSPELMKNKGAPLARTTAKGAGNKIPVSSVLCFSPGFFLSSGQRLIGGDEILVGGRKAVVIAVDREMSSLTLDRELAWKKDEPVTYARKDTAPDIGPWTP